MIAGIHGRIDTASAVDDVVAAAAAERIVAGPARERVVVCAAEDREFSVGLRRAVESQGVSELQQGAVDSERLARRHRRVIRGQLELVADIEGIVEADRLDIHHGGRGESDVRRVVAMQVYDIVAGTAVDLVGGGEGAEEDEDVVSGPTVGDVVAALVQVQEVVAGSRREQQQSLPAPPTSMRAGRPVSADPLDRQRVAGMQRRSVEFQDFAGRHGRVVRRELVAVTRTEVHGLDIDHRVRAERHARRIVAVEKKRIVSGATVDLVEGRKIGKEIQRVVPAPRVDDVVAGPRGDDIGAIGRVGGVRIAGRGRQSITQDMDEIVAGSSVNDCHC